MGVIIRVSNDNLIRIPQRDYFSFLILFTLLHSDKNLMFFIKAQCQPF